jgi:Sulfotransferase domain
VGRRLSVSQLDLVAGRARAAKAFPLLLGEQLISKRLISKRQELRQIKNKLLHNANSWAKGIEYKEAYRGYCLPIFFLPNHRALEIARDVKAQLTGKKHERQEFKQRRRKVCAAQAARDRAELYKIEKEKIQQKRAPIAAEKGALPDFVIIGAKKCGTTFLYDLLIEHPHVESAAQKELHYFDRYFDQGIDWYRRCFPAPKWIDGRTTITGEATPYLPTPSAAERMAKILPQARLIVLLRNPVDRAYSDYQQGVRLGRETRRFEEAIQAEKSEIIGKDEITPREGRIGPTDARCQYLRRGIYVDQLLHWTKFFTKDQILVLKSEDFFEHTPETLKVVLKFLGLSPPSSPKLRTDFRGWLRNKRHKGEYQQGMSSVTRRQLEEYFEPYNRGLYEYLDVDFGW